MGRDKWLGLQNHTHVALVLIKRVGMAMQFLTSNSTLLGRENPLAMNTEVQHSYTVCTRCLYFRPENQASFYAAKHKIEPLTTS